MKQNGCILCFQYTLHKYIEKSFPSVYLIHFQGLNGPPGFPGTPGDPGAKGEKVSLMITLSDKYTKA